MTRHDLGLIAVTFTAAGFAIAVEKTEWWQWIVAAVIVSSALWTFFRKLREYE